ncbi:MAG: hypothetical protein GOMPHAMPRED_004530 [Gomphillus americanus]|uniref:DNA-directed RNA polymerase III subunit RPC3 n=1 Tax=Gomphillus americanus TaxID=1940652 RepID=A0A8H3FNH4_9LECA|nr:MAG: hypothetical protein GOMPHAMPRED_004530 [Gomphillus americanus]
MIHGRQRLSDIVHHTRLAVSQVRHGLTILVQQRIVLWCLHNDVALYEADWLAAYSLLRSGKFVVATRKRIGQQGEAILSHCVLGGDLKASALEHANSNSNSGQGTVNGTNGSSAESADSQRESRAAIYDLLENSTVIITNPSHFRFPEKNRELVERQVRIDNPHWKDKVKNKEKAQFQRAMVDVSEEWKYGSKYLRTTIAKRRLTQLDNPLKREFATMEESQDNTQLSSKTSQTPKLPSVIDAAQSSFDDKIMLRANYDKYPVLARSQKLVQLAADNIGIPTSQVYATVLRLYDKDLTHCKEFQRGPETPMAEEDTKHSILTTKEILLHVGNMNSLQEAIGQPYGNISITESSIPRHKEPHRRKRQKREEGDQVRQINLTENGQSLDSDSDSDSDIVEPTRSRLNGKAKSAGTDKVKPNGEHKGKEKNKVLIAYDHDIDMDSASEDDDSSSAVQYVALTAHLKILTEHRLLNYHPPGTYDLKSEGWSVPLVALSHRLRLSEIDTTICTQFGADALRIVKALRKQGKLDEKALIGLVLMDSKAMRSRLSAMHTAGYVELQELPRDNNRAPSKTIYLWFFDEDRCAHQMQQDYYQAMSRCLQRLRVERERASDVLTKSQRSDVQGREQEFLVGDEWDRLQKWGEVEERLLGQVGRLDDGILLLRDL